MENSSAQRRWQGSFGADETRPNFEIDVNRSENFIDICTEEGKIIDGNDY